MERGRWLTGKLDASKTSPFGWFRDSILMSESGRMACGGSRGSGTLTSGMFG